MSAVIVGARLPGTIPGLLIDAAPVLVSIDRCSMMLGVYLSGGVIISRDESGIHLSRIGDAVAASDVWLNLAHPAGMDRAARFLAERLGIALGATAPRWAFGFPQPSRHDPDGAPYDEGTPARGQLDSDGDGASFCSPDEESDGWIPDRHNWFPVPGISSITSPHIALRDAVLATVTP